VLRREQGVWWKQLHRKMWTIHYTCMSHAIKMKKPELIGRCLAFANTSCDDYVSVGARRLHTCKNTSSNSHFNSTMSKSSSRYMKLSFGSPNSKSGWQSYAFRKIARWARLDLDTRGAGRRGLRLADLDLCPMATKLGLGPLHSARSLWEALFTTLDHMGFWKSLDKVAQSNTSQEPKEGNSDLHQTSYPHSKQP
jgi:hypothetical protein